MLKKETHLILIVVCLVNVYSDKKQESYNLTITDVSLCKGPKKKDCAIMRTQITSANVVEYEANVIENISPTKGKIEIISKGRESIRLQMKKPCEHVFIKPILHSVLNITDKCVIPKGHYRYVVDVRSITESYFGRRMLQGNWTFKSRFYSDECNFYCGTISVMIL